MRWWLLGLLALGCGTDPSDPSENGENGDTDNGGEVQLDLAWTDLRINTPATFNAIYVGGSGAFVVGANGSAWDVTQGQSALMATGVTAELTGVWGQGAGPSAELLTVGYGGQILRRAGRTWVEEEHEAVGTANFEDIDGIEGDLTAVSVTGIYRYIDGEWFFENNAFNEEIRDIYVQPDGVAWAVGDEGAIIRRELDIWYQVESPTTRDLRGIHGSGDHVFAVGHRGTVLSWNGQAFIDLEVDTASNLQAVWVAPSGKAFIVGNNGAAYRVDPPVFDEEGTEIEPGGVAELPSGASANLYGISGTDERNVWAVGNRGAIYRFRADFVPEYL